MKSMLRSIPGRLLRSSAAFVLILSLAAGCARNGASGSTPTPSPAASPAEAPVSGGVLRMPVSVNPDVSNPYQVNTEETLFMFSLVFEGLLRVDAANKLAPQLAETWVREEGTNAWTLNLRGNVRFHNNGKLLEASDVVHSFNQVSLAGAEGYYGYVLDYVESVTAMDSATVRVVMQREGMAGLYALNFPIVSSAAQTGLPGGTGPFYFNAVTDEGVSLLRNGSWWRQPAYFDGVDFAMRDNNDIALASYSAGQLDFVSTSARTAGRYRDEPGTRLVDVMTQNAELMLFNMAGGRFSDLRLRQAVLCALDRSELITNVYMNRAFATDVPVAPDSWTYDAKSKQYDHDVVRAQALLADMGFADTDEDGILEYPNSANKLEFTLLVNDTTDNTARREAAAIIASQLKEAGILVVVEAAAHSLAAANSEYLTRLKNGEFDLALVSVNLPRNDDLGVLLRPNGSRNYGKANVPELVALLDEMLACTAEGEYQAAASRLQMKFVETLPFACLYFRMHSVICDSSIRNLDTLRKPDLLLGLEFWYFG